MDKGIRLELLWHDVDVFEIRLVAWNGLFGGGADVYLAIGSLKERAEKLDGFPRSPADNREVIFGAFGPEYAGGAVSLRFFCGDGAGHAYVDLKIESDSQSGRMVQSVAMSLSIEPAAVDLFVDELRRLEDEKKGTARLGAV